MKSRGRALRWLTLFFTFFPIALLILGVGSYLRAVGVSCTYASGSNLNSISAIAANGKLLLGGTERILLANETVKTGLDAGTANPDLFVYQDYWGDGRGPHVVKFAGIIYTEQSGGYLTDGAWSLWIPIWYLILPLLPLPLLWVARKYRARTASARKPGICRECGYDLRASPARCPECGTPAGSPVP